MYIKTRKWTDSDEADDLADKYPHAYTITIYASDDTRKQLELEGQLEALVDGLLDWREMQDTDFNDWRSEIQ